MTRLDAAADAILDVTLKTCGRFIAERDNVAAIAGMCATLVTELGCSPAAAASALDGAMVRRALASLNPVLRALGAIKEARR